MNKTIPCNQDSSHHSLVEDASHINVGDCDETRIKILNKELLKENIRLQNVCNSYMFQLVMNNITPSLDFMDNELYKDNLQQTQQVSLSNQCVNTDSYKCLHCEKNTLLYNKTIPTINKINSLQNQDLKSLIQHNQDYLKELQIKLKSKHKLNPKRKNIKKNIKKEKDEYIKNLSQLVEIL